MNGTGIFCKVDQVNTNLNKLYDILKNDGQILIDSTDLIYMYNELNGLDLPIEKYYGEVAFTVYYKGKKQKPFPWLFIDFEYLKSLSKSSGLRAVKVKQVC